MNSSVFTQWGFLSADLSKFCRVSGSVGGLNIHEVKSCFIFFVVVVVVVVKASCCSTAASEGVCVRAQVSFFWPLRDVCKVDSLHAGWRREHKK